MKVRWKIHMVGLVGRQVVNGRGDVTKVSDEDGARYCKLGYAEPVAEKPAESAEKAVAPDPETRDEAEEKPKKRGRPKLPRDEDGNIIHETSDGE
ncbi:MAG: hypothetical protein ACRDMV_17980 [Streptosporangiales bacterium]